MYAPVDGRFPLILRPYTVQNARAGELLLDYDKKDLYLVDRTTGKRENVAKTLYQRIVAGNLENSYIEIADDDESSTVERHPNTFYMFICSSSIRA